MLSNSDVSTYFAGALRAIDHLPATRQFINVDRLTDRLNECTYVQSNSIDPSLIFQMWTTIRF